MNLFDLRSNSSGLHAHFCPENIIRCHAITVRPMEVYLGGFIYSYIPEYNIASGKRGVLDVSDLMTP